MSHATLKPPPVGWTYAIPEYKQIVMVAAITPSGLFCGPVRAIALGGGWYISADKTLGCPADRIERSVLTDGMDLAQVRAQWPYFVTAGAMPYGNALYAPASPEPPPIPDEWLTPLYRKQ